MSLRPQATRERQRLAVPQTHEQTTCCFKPLREDALSCGPNYPDRDGCCYHLLWSMKKLRPREVEHLAQRHTARKADPGTEPQPSGSRLALLTETRQEPQANSRGPGIPTRLPQPVLSPGLEIKPPAQSRFLHLPLPFPAEGLQRFPPQIKQNVFANLETARLVYLLKDKSTNDPNPHRVFLDGGEAVTSPSREGLQTPSPPPTAARIHHQAL